jgi:hypothetical protein
MSDKHGCGELLRSRGRGHCGCRHGCFLSSFLDLDGGCLLQYWLGQDARDAGSLGLMLTAGGQVGLGHLEPRVSLAGHKLGLQLGHSWLLLSYLHIFGYPRVPTGKVQYPNSIRCYLGSGMDKTRG